jgi:hypothetical protein
MIARARPQGINVLRRLAPKIGLLAGLASATVASPAHAQVNIDQGKSPAEIFSNDCATCHKSTRGLAAGKNSLMLSGFLREHYTASRDEAAALAAYVLGAGGAEAAPKQKTAEPKTQEPKTAERPVGAAAKTEEGTPAIMKPERPGLNEATHEEGPPVAAPKPEPTAPMPAAAAPVVTPAANPVASSASQTPAPAEAPSQEFSPTKSAAVPAESQPGDSTPVPRDHIPD